MMSGGFIMSEQSCNKPFKEAVCIDVMRVFDSCSSQECLEDLEFTFDRCDQEVINAADYIKSKCIKVIGVTFAVNPVPFNPGFFTVDVTYNFRAEIEAYGVDKKPPINVYGNASFSKKVILYGSDGNTQRFVSGEASHNIAQSHTSGCAQCCPSGMPPTAAVSIVEPMCLDAKLVAVSADVKKVLITIGIFAIVQLERPVSIMIPAFDYCVPEKECSTNSDSPCELFDKIKFPTDEFFPKSLEDKTPCHYQEEPDTQAE
jgi:hypothetical protein